MKTIRRIHAWLGLLFGPSIVLFALSGMLQLYGCHESEGGAAAPGWIVRMSQVHIHQTVQLPRARGPRPAPPPAAEGSAASKAPADAGERPSKPTTGPIKAFFLLMSLALIASTGTGMYIAFTSKRDRRLHVGLLAAGIVVPIVLLML